MALKAILVLPIIMVFWHNSILMLIKTQLALGFLILTTSIFADVINPSLIEFSMNKKGEITVEMTLNIEAILSDSANYKNSKDSPNTNKYDYFRNQTPVQVKQNFLSNLTNFLQQARLVINGYQLHLHLVSLEVPDIGYQGRPRLSKLMLKTKVDNPFTELIWYYNKSYGDFVYRHRFHQQNQYTWSTWQWVKSGNAPISFVINSPPKYNIETAFNYIGIGFLHILPKGLDHILFIIGIALLALSWQKLLTMVTLFTLAHSATLALAVYGIFNLPAVIVEPIIALSIAYIGVENLLKPRHLYVRYTIIFAFGLLHGLGFAAMLKNFELAKADLALALISFNIGVEIGQVLIIILVLLILAFAKHVNLNTKTYLIIPAAIIISVVGLLWTIERIIVIGN